MVKLILGLEYDGSTYFGWQRQRNVPTIQGCLEDAISNVANEEIQVFCASRTDSGVHAVCQVVHFHTSVCRSYFSWISGINRNLPGDITVRWVFEVLDVNFHARFSAIARRYRYIIYNSDVRSSLLGKRVYYYKKFLDVKKMQNSSRCLLGEQDFTSFSSLKCQSVSTFRNLHYLSIIRYGYYIVIDIQANAFVYRMIRNIIGSLIEVGCGYRPENWIAELLLSRDRSLAAGSVAPSAGLYLVKIKYPLRYIIPEIMNDCSFIFF